MIKRKIGIGTVFICLLIAAFSLAIAQGLQIEGFLGVKWGSVYSNWQFVNYDTSFWGPTYPKLFNEMAKKGYHFNMFHQGFNGWGDLDGCQYFYFGSYAGDANAKIRFCFVNDKFYLAEIYCFVNEGDIENKYENVKGLMIEKFGLPTDNNWHFTHQHGCESNGVHWNASFGKDKIDIACTILKDSNGRPGAVYIDYRDDDLYKRETMKL